MPSALQVLGRRRQAWFLISVELMLYLGRYTEQIIAGDITLLQMRHMLQRRSRGRGEKVPAEVFT